MLNVKNNKKENIYLFILCPPLQGSTALYRLLNTSPNVSTFLKYNMWMGEGSGLWDWSNGVRFTRLPQFKNYKKERWDPNLDLDISTVSDIYHNHWNTNKKILCDKSPPTICRAKLFENYFSKLGKVYFIGQIRNPYYCNIPPHKWNIYAEYQKWNKENLKNVLFLQYEDLCNEMDMTVNKILKWLPEIQSLSPNKVTQPMEGERGKIIKNYNHSIRSKKTKIDFFRGHDTLLKYFNYSVK